MWRPDETQVLLHSTDPSGVWRNVTATYVAVDVNASRPGGRHGKPGNLCSDFCTPACQGCDLSVTVAERMLWQKDGTCRVLAGQVPSCRVWAEPFHWSVGHCLAPVNAPGMPQWPKPQAAAKYLLSEPGARLFHALWHSRFRYDCALRLQERPASTGAGVPERSHLLQ